MDDFDVQKEISGLHCASHSREVSTFVPGFGVFPQSRAPGVRLCAEVPLSKLISTTQLGNSTQHPLLKVQNPKPQNMTKRKLHTAVGISGTLATAWCGYNDLSTGLVFKYDRADEMLCSHQSVVVYDRTKTKTKHTSQQLSSPTGRRNMKTQLRASVM